MKWHKAVAPCWFSATDHLFLMWKIFAVAAGEVCYMESCCLLSHTNKAQLTVQAAHWAQRSKIFDCMDSCTCRRTVRYCLEMTKKKKSCANWESCIWKLYEWMTCCFAGRRCSLSHRLFPCEYIRSFWLIVASGNRTGSRIKEEVQKENHLQLCKGDNLLFPSWFLLLWTKYSFSYLTEELISIAQGLTLNCSVFFYIFDLKMLHANMFLKKWVLTYFCATALYVTDEMHVDWIFVKHAHDKHTITLRIHPLSPHHP